MTKNTQKKWIEFGWSGAYPIQCIPPMKAWVFDFAKIGFPLSKMALTFHDDNLAFYVYQNEYEGHGQKFFKETLKNPKKILGFLSQTNALANQIFALEKPWRKIDFTKLSNRQLLKYHQRLFDIDEQLWRKGQPQNLLEMGNNYLTTYVKNALIENFGVKKEIEYSQILSTSAYHSKTENQDLDFIKLCKKARTLADAKKLSTLVKNHWLKYRWMTYGWTGPAVPLKSFEENLKEALRHPKTLAQAEKKLLDKNQTLQKQKILLKKLSPKLREMATVLRQILECKNRRTDAHSLTYFLADPLLKEMGRRLELSLNQLRSVEPSRVRSFFKTKNLSPVRNQINSEISYVCYWFEKGKGIKKYTGPKARKIMVKVLAGLPKVKETTELSGERAYQGKVKGKVKIILRAQDIGQFKKGEILVTAMTDPGFVPAMKIAKAVVTNSGGITCHAAIISRELRIPCVIGTRFATKIFKDGDRVEVDANKGIVKKL